MLEIKDAVAVITGGAGGIGEELARYWVRQQKLIKKQGEQFQRFIQGLGEAATTKSVASGS